MAPFAEIAFILAGSTLAMIFVYILASQPKRHYRAVPDLGKVLAIRCRCCGGLCVRPLRGQPGLCEVCETPLAGMPWAVEDRALLVERLTDEVIEGDAD